MSDARPGLNPKRLVALLQSAIQRCDLNLQGACVLTEAATGAYVITPVLAALAGATRVYGVTRPTRHGSLAEVTAETLQLAHLAGVADRLDIVTEITPAVAAEADIVTNSGHLRPIGRQLITALPPTAVIPLMYEAWEYRAEDLDLDACRMRGIAVAGTNECHPAVDVFAFLGALAAKQLMDSGIAVYLSRVHVLCDNSFAPHIERGLAQAGAIVTLSSSPALPDTGRSLDAIVVALRPRTGPVLGESDLEALAAKQLGTVVTQFWGDIDRVAASRLGVPIWPPEPPSPGHMGILLSAVGPESVVRLQAGGLKVGEILWRARQSGLSADQAVASAVDMGWAQAIQLDRSEMHAAV